MSESQAPALSGIHHVTAIAGDPQKNVNFYAGVLGLRLVKQTVDYDDPNIRHLYYGDALGRPGTILTFFPSPGANRGRHGIGQATVTTLSVPEGALDYWAERLRAGGVTAEEGMRFGQPVLAFDDPDGMALEIIAAGDVATAFADVGDAALWKGNSVPAEQHAVRGIFGVTLAVAQATLTATMLEQILGFRAVTQEGATRRFAVGNGGPGAFVDVLAADEAKVASGGSRALGSFPRGLMGAGAVHHVAWRTPSDADQQAWLQTLADVGTNAGPVMDRQYFHSIYFREPGGVLFEIATDPPGFTADGETPDTLGARLQLPDWLEPRRADIEQRLPKLRLP